MHLYKSRCYWYANLDVIGNAEATLQNQKEMERQGLSPIPTFHYGSDLKYLKNYVDNYNYIGIGGIVPLIKFQRKNNKLSSFLNKCYSIIPSSTKIHAWGCTHSVVCLSYPFYSVDSTSWKSPGKYGRSLVKKGINVVGIKNEFTSIYPKIYYDSANYDYAIILYKHFQFITELWTKRGVIWND